MPEMQPNTNTWQTVYVFGQGFVDRVHQAAAQSQSRKSNCEHNKRKDRCRHCGGAALCEHNKRKEICRLCGGSSFCEHNKQKTLCRHCGGASICVHGKQKSRCRLCGGASICVHGKQQNRCRLCGGASICVHGKVKYICRLCGGTSICVHGKEKKLCRSSMCKLCKFYVGTSKYDGHCVRCFCKEFPEDERAKKKVRVSSVEFLSIGNRERVPVKWFIE
jgi:hypothetical protein